MKALPWVLAGLGLGFVAYHFLYDARPEYSDGSDDIGTATRKIFRWGAKQRTAGTGRRMAGQLKEGLGRVTGDDDLAEEGLADQAAGTLRDATGALAHAAGQTIQDLTR
jgi:uncharacterized protein YjbJ (UPF0337 family)